MPLSHSALLQILDAIKEADAADRVPESAATIYQALMEAELTSVIGAEPHRGATPGPGNVTVTDPGCSCRFGATMGHVLGHRGHDDDVFVQLVVVRHVRS